MPRISKNQQGFSVIEGLLIVIIVLLIGFIGYYVWHAQKESNNTLTSTAKTNQNTSSKTTPKIKYVTIKEWGVRAPYDGNLTLEYAVQNSTVDFPIDYAGFTSAQLDASSATCKASHDQGEAGAVGTIDRYAATQNYLVGDAGQDSGQTAAQYAATLNKADYGHVGNYYYFYTSPQSTCATDPASQNIFDQTKDAVKALLPKLQNVPSS